MDEASVTAWATALYEAGLSCHPEDGALTIIDGTSGEYLFTYREARLYLILLTRVWTLSRHHGFDPNGIWLDVFRRAEGDHDSDCASECEEVCANREVCRAAWLAKYPSHPAVLHSCRKCGEEVTK